MVNNRLNFLHKRPKRNTSWIMLIIIVLILLLPYLIIKIDTCLMLHQSMSSSWADTITIITMSYGVCSLIFMMRKIIKYHKKQLAKFKFSRISDLCLLVPSIDISAKNRYLLSLGDVQYEGSQKSIKICFEKTSFKLCSPTKYHTIYLMSSSVSQAKPIKLLETSPGLIGPRSKGIASCVDSSHRVSQLVERSVEVDSRMTCQSHGLCDQP